MNEKVDDITPEKASEETAEDLAVAAGATEAAASAAGEQPDTADSADQDSHSSGGRSWFTTLLLFTLLAATAGASGYFILEMHRDRNADRAEIRSLADRLETLQQSHGSLEKNARLLDKPVDPDR